ncbi:hypothetical protein ENSA5_54830 [Enhygromyxa salina]|uniref:Protein kinase domain-containing protein n=1 Tax=Enhygromyxa salina TaxID=215803 RepID=A0A2S9XF72_9BACT|nr:hypothetical protein [Enhygromyxa salina]PRP91509.1 hypothetical protein ENSA5_54830 [Enhygromyxa salina]
MICANCAKQIDAGAQSCPACGGDPLLGGHYRLDRVVAEDRRGLSYRATRTKDGRLVRARILALPRGSEGDDDRPSAAFPELDHPAFPRLIEHGTVGRKDSWWTVHEHVPGQLLAARLDAEAERCSDRGWLLELIGAVAEALAYLHERDQPIVHGSVSLDTIVVRNDTPCSISLLDVARVSDATLTPATDIRALGLAILALLTGERAILPEVERLRASVGGDDQLTALLGRMLEAGGTPRITSCELREAVIRLHSSRPNPAPSSPRELELRSPPTARTSAKPAPRFMMIEPISPRPGPASLRSARVPGRSQALRRSSVRSPREDVPVMRPEELSRELSQAHHATTALEQRQRKQLNVARGLVVVIAAIITALATYIATTL